MAIMLAFGAVVALPDNASADYGYYNGYGTTYGSYSGGSPYVYNRPPPMPAPQPVVVTQPPVFVQQPVVVQQPVYVQQPVVIERPIYTYYSPLSVSCSANATYLNNSGAITWSARASGGNGNYSYVWSGTDGLYGSGQSVYFNYINPGTKYASVTVYSDGQTVTQGCSNTVNVVNTYYDPYPTTYQQQIYPAYAVGNSNKGLDIGCYVDPTNAKVNQPVTWSAEVTGGMAPYTYSWTGSDGLTGSQSSIIKYYNTTGSKSAIVTVTSADGKSAVRACSNSLTIAGATTAAKVVYKAPPKKEVQRVDCCTVELQKQNQSNNQNNNVVGDNQSNGQNYNQTASSLFSLSNVPWGWVAILIMLVLFFTVIYLLFNRTKI